MDIYTHIYRYIYTYMHRYILRNCVCVHIYVYILLGLADYVIRIVITLRVEYPWGGSRCWTAHSATGACRPSSCTRSPSDSLRGCFNDVIRIVRTLHVEYAKRRMKYGVSIPMWTVS